MATYSFTRLSSGTVKVVTSTDTFFIPGNCKVDPNDTYNRIIIYSLFGDKIQMDSELDTINITGTPNTGTATEIAEDLASDIFFLASSGGGGVEGPVSSTDNALVRFDGTTGELLQNSNAILTDAGNLMLTGNNLGIEKSDGLIRVDVGVGNLHSDGAASLSIYADTASLSLQVKGSTDQSAPNEVRLEVGNNDSFRIFSASDIEIYLNGDFAPLLVIPIDGIDNYADDAAAATGGVPINGLYRIGNALQIRLA